MKKDVLFFFVEADGRTRQIVNGVVVSLANKKQLPQGPIGSHDIAIVWERSLVWWGNIRNFSFPLSFVMDGGKILRNDAYKFNVDRELYLLILRHVCEVDPVYYRDYYKFLYKGQLDFSSFNDKQSDPAVQINIMEGGINKLLKSQAATQFTIPFDEDAVNLKLDGIFLTQKHNFITLATLYSGDSLLGVLQTTKEGEAAFVASFTIYNQSEPGDLTTSLEYFLTTSQAITNIRIKGSISFSTLGLGNFQLILKSSEGQSILLTPVITAASLADFDVLFSSVAGEKFFLTLNASGGFATGDLVETSISVEFQSKFATSYIQAYKPLDFYKKLCAKMGIDPLKATSAMLSTCNILITSGDGVRGITSDKIPKVTVDAEFIAPGRFIAANKSMWKVGREIRITNTVSNNVTGVITLVDGPIATGPHTGEYNIYFNSALTPIVNEVATDVVFEHMNFTQGAAIKTSFNDFFKAYSIYLMAGVGVEAEELKFERFNHWFKPDTITAATELGEAKEMVITEAVDQMFSSIKIGHKEQDISNVNGKFDFNGYQIYTSPLKSVSRQLDLQSPYKAGPYEIEITRLNLDGKTTTDNGNDNDVFVIAAKPDSANNIFQTSAEIYADGAPFTPGYPLLGIVAPTPLLSAGMTIRVSGSASNNGDYTIASATPWFFGQLIATNEPLVNEASVIITIEIIKGQNFNLDRTILVTEGVPDPIGIFNVPLSPKRLLMEWLTWLRSFLYKFDADSLIFETANRNADLIAGGIIEKANVPINDMGNPIARPFYLEFGTQVPVSLNDSLEADMNRCFATMWERTRYTGFLWNAGLAPVSRIEQKFKLLMTSENDPEDLIL